MKARLDWTDAGAVARWLNDLRAVVDDAHGVTADMLKAPRRRELGPVLHRHTYREARRGLVQLLRYATPAPPDDDGSGAPPTH